MTHKIHHKVHTEHLAYVLACRAFLRMGGSFYRAPDNDRNPKGEDPQGLRAKHESVGRNGIGGKVVA